MPSSSPPPPPPWQDTFTDLMALAQQRKSTAHPSYTARLLQEDEDALLKKLIEEAGEAALAAKSGDPTRLRAELADLFFHCFIAMTRYNITLQDIGTVLARRRGIGGDAEKAARHSPPPPKEQQHGHI